VGELDRQVARVQHRALGRLSHEPVGIVGDELIRRRHRQDHDGVRELVAPARSPHLLPEAGPRPRKAALHHHLQAPDVDAELERVGGDDAEELAVDERALDRAALLGCVAGAVSGDQLRLIVPAIAQPIRAP
jgi:hypothetical protein